MQLLLVVFDTNDVVVLGFYDGGDGVFLTMQSISRKDHPGEAELLDQLGNERYFVGLVRYFALGQNLLGFHRKHTDQVSVGLF